MARLIKLANQDKNMVKLSSQEWLNSGIKNNLFYKENGIIKTALGAGAGAGAGAGGTTIGSRLLFDENQGKLKDPSYIAALLAYRSRAVPQGYEVLEIAVGKDPTTGKKTVSPSPGSGLFAIKNVKTGKIADPTSPLTMQNYAAILNKLGTGAASGSGTTPNPVTPDPVTPDPKTPDPKIPDQPIPKKPRVPKKPKAPKVNWLGVAGAGLAGGLTGYGIGQGIAKLTEKDNTIRHWNPNEFYKGLALLQEAVAPISGINSTLDAYMKDAMKAVGDIAAQAQKMPSGMAGFNQGMKQPQAPAQGANQGFPGYIKD